MVLKTEVGVATRKALIKPDIDFNQKHLYLLFIRKVFTEQHQN